MTSTPDNTPRRFFLMPIPPTPNGRLHLGHVAGPYLRMDMIGRYLKVQGHHVDTISAVDGFDSYVLWKAMQEARPPEEVCRHYHAEIAHDLAALDIHVDAFLDLVQGPRAAQHARNAIAVVEELVEHGLAETVVEKVLFSRATGRYLVGAWVTGGCPSCSAPVAGYFCEACGALFRPEQMLTPQPRAGDTDLEWREVESLFLRITDRAALERGMESCGAPAAFARLIRRQLDRENNLFRLTAPGTWGVAWPADRWGNPRILFEAAWEYALTCGDHYAAGAPDRAHPMRRDSDVTTLVSFGIDNAVLLLAGNIPLLNASHGRKPFDYVLTNYFYNLQGAKFSTSRQHAIWAADIVEKTPASSDAVRGFLARESPEHETTNFDIFEFVAFATGQLAGQWQRRIDRACQTLMAAAPDHLAVPPELQFRLEAAMTAFDRAFRLDAFSARAASAVLESWANRADVDLSHVSQAYGWLKGLAYLAAPIMPHLAEHVWHMVGHELPILRRDLPVQTRPRGEAGRTALFRPVSLQSLRPCLPDSIALEERVAARG
ncbi:MAG: methionine--tRNA ligase [Pseudomonadota bacterium]